MDSLDFLNDEPQPPIPLAPRLQPAAPTAPPPPQIVAAPAAPQPTRADHAAALEAALNDEMKRRGWARAGVVASELEGARQHLDWLGMQSFTQRALALASGQRARAEAEVQHLARARREAGEREKALRRTLLADPFSKMLVEADAQAMAAHRATDATETQKLIAERQAEATALQRAGQQRERQALALAEAAKDDDQQPSKKKRSTYKPK